MLILLHYFSNTVISFFKYVHQNYILVSSLKGTGLGRLRVGHIELNFYLWRNIRQFSMHNGSGNRGSNLENNHGSQTLGGQILPYFDYTFENKGVMEHKCISNRDSGTKILTQ